MSASNTPRIAVDVGVLVVDMDRSLEFYRDTLGLSEIGEVALSLIGKGRMVQLRHGASLVKLVQLEGGSNASSPAEIAGAYGYRYMTLMVTNIANMMARIESKGVLITLPMTRLGNGAIIAMVADPDGNIVEFVQEA